MSTKSIIVFLIVNQFICLDGFTINKAVLPQNNINSRITWNSSYQSTSKIRINELNGVQRTSKSLPVLQMCAPMSLGIAAGAIGGGFFAGGLHAISGPDHLAALIPRCCGQRWFRAGRIGALWGMGHGVSATLLGIIAFALKNRLNKIEGLKFFLSGASNVLEIAVGASLILIGLMGIREAREWEEDIDVSPQSLSSAAVDIGVKSTKKRAVVFNGLLHGLSWDGAPSLAPALAVATWGGNLSFLFSYAVGTATTMAITTTLVGEGTRAAGDMFKRPDIPQKLSLVSSFIAILIGSVWCGLALI